MPEDELDEEIAEGFRLLAERLRSLREEAGLSQPQLADDAGVSVDSLRSIETNRRMPTLTTLARLARRLGTTPLALLSGIHPWDSDVPRPD